MIVPSTQDGKNPRIIQAMQLPPRYDGFLGDVMTMSKATKTRPEDRVEQGLDAR